MLRKINFFVFLSLFLILGATFFTRNNLRSVKEISREILKQPKQTKINRRGKIKFFKDGYAYELTPVENYEINGLLVSKKGYKLFSIYKSASVFPFDVCLIWGNNVRNRVFQHNSIKFYQDCRWCMVEWLGDVNFNFGEISNNHLIFQEESLERKAAGFVIGDQVRIKGMLVNVDAYKAGKTEIFNPKRISWATSTQRHDSGKGACEIIYVTGIDMLKKANMVSRYLFLFSIYGLIIMALMNCVWFVTAVFFKK